MSDKTAVEVLAELVITWAKGGTPLDTLITEHLALRIAANDAEVRAAAWLAAREQAALTLESFSKGCLGSSRGTSFGEGVTCGRSDIIEAGTRKIRALTPPADVEKFLAERDERIQIKAQLQEAIWWESRTVGYGLGDSCESAFLERKRIADLQARLREKGE